MFHTIITFAYIVPNIYVFFRIWQLFINKGYRHIYTLIYLLLAAVYPLGNLFSESDTGFISGILNTAGEYILPFYLYLFLSVLAFDIFLLINLLFRIVPFEKFRTYRFKRNCLSSILLISVIVLVAGIINFNTIRTSEYRVEIPEKSSKIKNLRIAFVADFHLKEGVSVSFVERFVNKIEEIHPDLMIFGGDIVEGDRNDGKLTQFEKLIGGIKSKYGVYAVMGNHEHYAGEEKGSFFSKSAMKVLCDSIVVIDSSFNMVGRNDSHISERMAIDELMKTSEDSLPVIMIDHRPTEIEQVSKTAIDIQLSGHTHNGQLFPINLITRKVYELSWGYLKKGNTHFFVTSGIRLWGPPVRTTGKSEIMVIDIDFISK